MRRFFRGTGEDISDEAHEDSDLQQRGFLENLFGQHLDEDAWNQAKLGVKSGGLGWTKARDLALPAVIASLTDACPPVLAFISQAPPGLFSLTRARRAVDIRLKAATDRWTSTLDTITADQVRNVLQAAFGRLSSERSLAPHRGSSTSWNRMPAIPIAQPEGGILPRPMHMRQTSRTIRPGNGSYSGLLSRHL